MESDGRCCFGVPESTAVPLTPSLFVAFFCFCRFLWSLRRSMLRRCATVITPRALVYARTAGTRRCSSLRSSHSTARPSVVPCCFLPHRSMSAVPYSRPPLLPPSPHDRSQPLQVFPALLPASEHSPAAFPFGRIALPAAGVFFATALSYVSVNQSPLMAGHVLVMPRSNQARVKDLSEEHLTDLWITAQHVARVFEDKFKAEAMTFGQKKQNHTRAEVSAHSAFSLSVG